MEENIDETEFEENYEDTSDLVLQKYTFKDYQPRSPIIFETSTGVVCDARYRKTLDNGANIILDSVSEFPHIERSSERVPAYYSSYEIKYLHIFEEKNKNINKVCPMLSGISYADFLHFKDMIWTNKYVPVHDSNFQNILQEIRNCSVIGIVSLGSHSDKVRHARISFFVVATKNKIFLFDIKFTPKTFWEMGLKNILEDDNILKVLYDGKTEADLLYNRYKIKLKNIFDVSVADYEITNKINKIDEYPKKFSELVEIYLFLPKGMFQYSELVVTGVSHTQRPVKDKMKRSISLLGVFLIPLYENQRAMLLQNFFMASQIYSDSLVSRSDFCREEKLKEMDREICEEVAEFINETSTKSVC